MPQQKTLIHYAAMHCLCGSSDKLYTLMIYRLEQDASARHDNISFEAWAHWGARGAQQKATYKCQGNRSAIAEYVDRKVDEQERKDYVIVAGGKVGQNYDYWYTAPLIPYPVTIEGKLPRERWPGIATAGLWRWLRQHWKRCRAIPAGTITAQAVCRPAILSRRSAPSPEGFRPVGCSG